MIPRPTPGLDSRDPAALELIAAMLAQNLAVRIRVTGHSMQPFVRCDDWVTLQKVCREDLSVGQLVFYRSAEGLPVLHRIVRIGNSSNGAPRLTTKGDALIRPDRPVRPRQVLGRVVRLERVRDDGTTREIDLRTPQWRMINTLLGRAHPLTGLWSRLRKRVVGRRAKD